MKNSEKCLYQRMIQRTSRPARRPWVAAKRVGGTDSAAVGIGFVPGSLVVEDSCAEIAVVVAAAAFVPVDPRCIFDRKSTANGSGA